MPPPVILAYHAVSDVWLSPLAVTRRALAEQLGFFRGRGYTALTFAAAERLRREHALPPKSVVITFDDGFGSVLRALPLLETLGWPATVFVVTDFAASGRHLDWHGLGDEDSKDERVPLTWDDLRGLRDLGWEIGSHTKTHPLLPRLPRAGITSELAASRDEIARELGGCVTLAYPFGVGTVEVGTIAQDAGYTAACTLRGTQRQDEPMLRPRVRLDSTHRGWRIRAATSGVNRRLRASRAADLASRARGTRSWFPADGAY
jgi:peptidoglycan/xylan/chitin deacetylase (PgdA/CDA1 family)